MTNKNISTFIKIPTLTIAISLLVVASLFLASLFLNAHTASAQYGSGEYGADEYSTQQAVDDGTDPPAGDGSGTGDGDGTATGDGSDTGNQSGGELSDTGQPMNTISIFVAVTILFIAIGSIFVKTKKPSNN
jgi:hypothetical protein